MCYFKSYLPWFLMMASNLMQNHGFRKYFIDLMTFPLILQSLNWDERDGSVLCKHDNWSSSPHTHCGIWNWLWILSSDLHSHSHIICIHTTNKQSQDMICHLCHLTTRQAAVILSACAWENLSKTVMLWCLPKTYSIQWNQNLNSRWWEENTLRGFFFLVIKCMSHFLLTVLHEVHKVLHIYSYF